MCEFIHIVKENATSRRILFRSDGVAEWSLAATKERPFRRNSATPSERRPVVLRPAAARLQLRRVMAYLLPPSHPACGF